MWDIVENKNFKPLNREGMSLPKSSQSDDKKSRYLLNFKTKNTLTCALCKDVEKVQQCKSAKDMWDTLTTTY